MKPSNSFSFVTQTPSLFQIAAFFEDFFPAGGLSRSVAAVHHLPVAEYMLNPDKLMKLLRSNRTENHAVDMATPDKGQGTGKRAMRTTAAKKPSGPPPGKSNGPAPDTLKKVEFTLKSPSASSVKLAGDFTDWDKSALEMTNSGNGAWSAVVPLSPGSYSYRFIVDGKWCDDPGSLQQVPNPFGSRNAVVRVT